MTTLKIADLREERTRLTGEVERLQAQVAALDLLLEAYQPTTNGVERHGRPKSAVRLQVEGLIARKREWDFEDLLAAVGRNLRRRKTPTLRAQVRGAVYKLAQEGRTQTTAGRITTIS